MSAPILELKELDVFYGPIQALKKVSMHINEGETVSLIGANGAGKSTLLMSIFGQPRAASGQILYRGTDITRKSPHFIASNGIAQSPEGRRVFPDMSVEENLMMGTIPIGDKHRHPRIALKIHDLLTASIGPEAEVTIYESEPHRDKVRGAVSIDGGNLKISPCGEVGLNLGLGHADDVSSAHGSLPSRRPRSQFGGRARPRLPSAAG